MVREIKSCHWLLPTLMICAVMMLAGCKTESPPPRDEIQKQALDEVSLDRPWSAAPASSEAVQDNWLASFDDAQLDALVSEAMVNNPDLRVSAARVEQATGYVAVAKAALLPAVSVLGTGGLKMSGGSDLSSALQGIGVGVSWEPDLWGRIRYGRNAAQEMSASVEADYEFARQSLAATVARGWFTATETQLQIALAERMVVESRALETIAEERFRVGPGSEQDVVIARANRLTFEDSLRQVQFAHEQSLRAVELLLGRYPAAELQARAALPALPGDVPVGMPLEMLERRPDVIAAERRVAAAFNRVGQAKAARLPQIILNAGIAALDSEVLQFKDDYSNPSLGAGAKLIAPIYQGGALDAQVDIRTAEQKESVALYARTALQAINDVETALATGGTLEDRSQLLASIVADNQRALELARINYEVGRQDLRSVAQQQLAVHAANLGLLRVESEQLAQRVNLHLALGGRFEAPAVANAAAKTP